MLSNIEPIGGVELAAFRQKKGVGRAEPEVKIVYRALLVAHVNVEGEEINRGKRPAAEHLHQGRQPITLSRRHRR